MSSSQTNSRSDVSIYVFLCNERNEYARHHDMCSIQIYAYAHQRQNIYLMI